MQAKKLMHAPLSYQLEGSRRDMIQSVIVDESQEWRYQISKNTDVYQHCKRPW